MEEDLKVLEERIFNFNLNKKIGGRMSEEVIRENEALENIVANYKQKLNSLDIQENLIKHLGNEVEKLQKERQKYKEETSKIYIEANNTLYFDDSSDYCGALWNILRIINPNLEEYPDLEYIEEANDITTDMSEDIKKLIAEIKIKDKIIDRMAIKIHTLDDNNTKYCDGKSNCDCEISHCKDCIKQHFETIR